MFFHSLICMRIFLNLNVYIQNSFRHYPQKKNQALHGEENEGYVPGKSPWLEGWKPDRNFKNSLLWGKCNLVKIILHSFETRMNPPPSRSPGPLCGLMPGGCTCILRMLRILFLMFWAGRVGCSSPWIDKPCSQMLNSRKNFKLFYV